MKNNILITGGSSQIVIAYLNSIKEKSNIILQYNSNEKVINNIHNPNLKILPIKADFSNYDAIIDFSKKLVNLPIPNKIFHNACHKVKHERFTEIDINKLNNDYNISITSIIEILRIILPIMKKNNNGKILFTLTSYLYGIPPKYLTSYLILKNTLQSIKKSLIAEYSSYQIQFNSISPSLIETNFLQNLNEKVPEIAASNNPLKRNLKISEIIPAINYFFDDNNTFTNGEDILISGGENIK